eukprot:4236725-Alexandrium_andersonii.AAC.1
MFAALLSLTVMRWALAELGRPPPIQTSGMAPPMRGAPEAPIGVYKEHFRLVLSGGAAAPRNPPGSASGARRRHFLAGSGGPVGPAPSSAGIGAA